MISEALVHVQGDQEILSFLPREERLTETQSHLLVFIRNFYDENNFYPTHREMAQELRINSTNVSCYLSSLIKKGFLAKVDAPRCKTNFVLTMKGWERTEKILKKQKESKQLEIKFSQ